MPREKKRRGEKPKWRSRAKTWVARVWEVDGTCSGWTDLGTDNKVIAYERYERWLETGVPPETTRGKETFDTAATRVVDAAEKCGEITARNAKERRARLRDYALPRLGMLEIARIEPHHVAKVLDAMAKTDGMAAGTILKMRSDISQILAALVREGEIQVNFARNMSLPKSARVDNRERVMLTDEQVLHFQRRRGFNTPLDMMVLFSRCVAGHRTSDIHAGIWQHVDLDAFTWMKVRRPKTDGEVGQNVRAGRRRARVYEYVVHEVDEEFREPIKAYWIRQGRPKGGPIFPLLRDGPKGAAKDAKGKVLYVRKGSTAGDHKGEGNSYAAALRRAVWEAEIFDPMPLGTMVNGMPTTKTFDPEHPDPALCRLQSDTDETKRLDFQSFRKGLATALADAGTNVQTALAILGHTQMTTQLKHYMGKRRVKVPRKALPGGAVEETPAFSPEVLAAMETLRAALRPESSQVLPRSGRNGGSRGSGSSANTPDSLASPARFELATSALGMQGRPEKGSKAHSKSPKPRKPSERIVADRSASKPVLSHDAGDFESPNDDGEAALAAAVDRATAAGQFDLARELLAELRERRRTREVGESPTGIVSVAEFRKRQAERGGR